MKNSRERMEQILKIKRKKETYRSLMNKRNNKVERKENFENFLMRMAILE